MKIKFLFFLLINLFLRKKDLGFKNLSLTAVLVEEPEDGYSAFIEEIPGVNT